MRSNVSVKSLCSCRTPPFHYTHFERTELGDDSRGADVSICVCKSCGTKWLNYLIEEPQYTAAGRWWRVELPSGVEMTPEKAKVFVEAQRDGFAGGSRFNSTGFAVYTPIRVY
jgi:hypothetical protein